MVLRFVIAFVALFAAPEVFALSVLLAGTGNGSTAIQASLVSLGHTVTRSDSDTLPVNISSYDTAWVHTSATLSQADIAKLEAFVESGKGVYLNGDNSTCCQSNSNGEALVNATVTGAASIGIGAGTCNVAGYGFPNPSAVQGVASAPHAPTHMAFAGAGCIAGAAPANQVVTAAGNTLVAAWRDGDMVGNRGRIAIVMDSNWANLGDAWFDEWVANLQRFLHATVLADGFEAGSSSILRCDNPADGAVIDVVPGAGVPITGTAVDLSNLTVNGVPLTISSDGTFSAMVTGRYGLNFVALTASNAAGAPQTALCAFLGAERWVTEGAPLLDGVLFRFEPAGFTKLKSLFSTWFSDPTFPQALDTSLLAANPLATMSCGATGTCVREVRYLSQSTTVSAINVMAVNLNTLEVSVQLDIRLFLRVRSQNFGAQSTTDGNVLFDNGDVIANIDLGIDIATGRPIATGSNVRFNPGTVSAQFPGLDPQFLTFVISTAQDSLTQVLAVEASRGAAGLFQGLFAGMAITPTAAFPVGRLDGTGDLMVALGTRASTVGLQNNGFRLGTATSVAIPPPPPNATGRVPLPVAPEPTATRSTDTWSALQVGVFNQMLHTLRRAALFDGTVDGAALGTGLPAGTSVAVQLRTMPVVTGFDAGGNVGLDVGALDLIVTRAGLPPALRVTTGARIRAQAALVAADLEFDNFVVDELRVSTGAVTLDPASQALLQDLVERLLVKLADIALNDSLPVLPATEFTIPGSLAPYGLTPGSQLVGPPTLVIEPNYLFLYGNIGSGGQNAPW